MVIRVPGARTKHDTYAAFVRDLETELANAGSLGLVFVDGDGSDPSFRSTNRGLRLADRRVVEDAVHPDSRSSQLVQMADLVAWSANAYADRHPGSAFAWDWYSTYFAERDPLRAPRAV